MSTKDRSQQQPNDELSEQQLDGVAGGQEVRKLDKIVVTAKREDVNVASAAVNTAGIKTKR